MHKAIVVDDHPFIRASVKMVLQQENFDVVAETDNGADAVQLARTHVPALIVLDIGIPRLDGLQVIARIAAQGLPSKTLVLTAQPASYFSTRCMNAGASGYVSKMDDLNDLSKAIHVVMSGYNYFPNLSVASVRRSDNEASEDERIATLSDRELMVLQQLARGVSNKDISDDMMLSTKTISTYKVRLIGKLGVASVVDLADFAKRHHLI
ncbi:response regulator transcription factor [Pseudomonas vranovensis]|uniref:response regulator transcription factor n=1 Tax=Pseudomonas vranovensis TaxID=321661 RepID=UPI000422F133|nr:response regulator transcription factor [Pseudomonas vranovensis]